MRFSSFQRKTVVAAVALGIALSGAVVPSQRSAHASDLAQGGRTGNTVQLSGGGGGGHNQPIVNQGGPRLNQGGGNGGNGGNGNGGNGGNNQGAQNGQNSGQGVQRLNQGGQGGGNGGQNSPSNVNAAKGNHEHPNGHNSQLWVQNPQHVYHNHNFYVQYVPVVYQVYYGPFFGYDYSWYLYRHLTHPNLFVVYVDEPVLVCTTEYYFYEPEGVFYCFVG